MYCLVNKLSFLPYKEEPTVKSGYIVQYTGRLHPTSTESIYNALALLIHHRGGKTASIYRMNMEDENGRPTLDAHLYGTFTKVKGRWIAEDVEGGLATRRNLQILANRLTKTPEQLIPLKTLQGGMECKFAVD